MKTSVKRSIVLTALALSLSACASVSTIQVKGHEVIVLKTVSLMAPSTTTLMQDDGRDLFFGLESGQAKEHGADTELAIGQRLQVAFIEIALGQEHAAAPGGDRVLPGQRQRAEDDLRHAGQRHGDRLASGCGKLHGGVISRPHRAGRVGRAIAQDHAAG